MNHSSQVIKPSYTWLIISGIATGIFFGLLLMSSNDMSVNVNPPDSDEIILESTSNPVEQKPSSSEEYSVPSNQPRRIYIPSIDADGYIQKVGVDQNNKIAAPSNVHFAGWYIFSVPPGEQGLSIIDGHVSGRYSDGVFKNLAELKVGNRFQIEYGDMSFREFEVSDVKTLPENDSAAFLLKKDALIDSQLNLIACVGNFNKSSQTYEDRIIVVSKLVIN